MRKSCYFLESRLPPHIQALANKQTKTDAAASRGAGGEGGNPAGDTSNTKKVEDDPILKVINKPLKDLQAMFPELKADSKGRPSAGAWCKWLGMGEKTLMDWRDQVREFNENIRTAPKPQEVQALDDGENSKKEENSGGSRAMNEGGTVTPTYEGYGSDYNLLRWGNENNCLLSPGVRLVQYPSLGGSTFVANRDTPAGMLLMSIPQDALIDVTDPTFDYSAVNKGSAGKGSGGGGNDDEDIHEYLAQLDELIFRILRGSALESDKHHGYCMYLRYSQDPPPNLPFLGGAGVFQSELSKSIKAAFEEAVKEPYHPKLRGSGLPEKEYRWAASMALSRRHFGALLCPWVDKLNHASSANVYTTLPGGGGNSGGAGREEVNSNNKEKLSSSVLTGVDVLDNLISGVPEECLFQPYLHLKSIERIKRSDALVMSYSDVDPSTEDGQDSWLSNWGMIPDRKPVITSADQKNVAMMLARHRVVKRKVLFPS